MPKVILLPIGARTQETFFRIFLSKEKGSLPCAVVGWTVFTGARTRTTDCHAVCVCVCTTIEQNKEAQLAQLQVSVASLEPHDKEGFLTKQGGAIKTWKRRWFVLKGNKLWYFKGRTDTSAKGFIELEPTTLVRDEGTCNKKKKPMFSIQARGLKGRRLFMIYPETAQERDEWIDAIRRNVAACSAGGFAKQPDTPAGEGDCATKSLFTPHPHTCPHASHDFFFFSF